MRRRALVGLVVAALSWPATAGATEPPPAPGYAPAVATPADIARQVYYRRPDGSLRLWTAVSEGQVSAVNLGGALSTAPSATVLRFPTYRRSYVAAAGSNGKVYYRTRSDLSGAVWQPWTSLGGGTTQAPSMTCTPGQFPVATVWVRGGDGALWRRTTAPSPGWQKIGGALASAPAAVPAVWGICPPAEDVVARGTDGAVWEWRAGGWSKVGGRTPYAPAILRDPADGRGYLFVVGSDGALWWSRRNDDASPWLAFQKIGGTFTSAPSAQLHADPGTDPQTTVYALGGDDQVWVAYREVGDTDPWQFYELTTPTG